MNPLLTNLTSAVIGALVCYALSGYFCAKDARDMSSEIEIHELNENEIEILSTGGFTMEVSTNSEPAVTFESGDYLGKSIESYPDATLVEGEPFQISVDDFNAVFLVEDGKIVNFIRLSDILE